MIRSRHLMFGFCWLACFGMSLSHFAYGAPPASAVEFPFRAKVDERAGQTKDWPNRIRHERLGQWFRLVPSGEYAIGDNALADSKAIKVELSPFYVAETTVTWHEYRPYSVANVARLQREIEGMAEEACKDVPEKSRADTRLFVESMCYGLHELFVDDSLVDVGPFDDAISSARNDLVAKLLDSAKDKRLDELGVDLTPEEREKARESISAFWKRIDAMHEGMAKRGDDIFDRASFREAEQFAAAYTLNLPTEAQWEVAARLTLAEKLPMREMGKDVREWCADYYAFDYFQRKNEFADPQGPRHGRLSPEQFQREADSSIGLGTWLRSRGYRVLRGGKVAQRHYGAHASQGIRLVFDPRRVMIEKLPPPRTSPSAEGR